MPIRRIAAALLLALVALVPATSPALEVDRRLRSSR
jgi:hypothetical protein